MDKFKISYCTLPDQKISYRTVSGLDLSLDDRKIGLDLVMYEEKHISQKIHVTQLSVDSRIVDIKGLRTAMTEMKLRPEDNNFNKI